MKVSCMRKLLAITLITSITFTSCVSWYNGSAREIEEYPTKRMKSEEKKTTIASQTRSQIVGLASDAYRHSNASLSMCMICSELNHLHPILTSFLPLTVE